MDIEDRDIEEAELEASPSRFSQESALRVTSTSFQTPSLGQGLSRGTTRRTRDVHPTELDRIATHGHIHKSTVGKKPTLKRELEAVKTLGAGKVFEPADYNVEDFLVEFDGHDDPLHPQNWPLRKR